jgi:hypothetical protein
MAVTDVPVPRKIWNAALKVGGDGSSNMAVNGSVTPVVFSKSANANADFEIMAMSLIAEFSGSVAIGNKFIADAVGTLANGLLVEAQINGESYNIGNLKRSRDLIEVGTPEGGFNIIAGTNSLFQLFFFVPPEMIMAKTGSFSPDDYVRATVRDDLSSFNFLEIFLQGVKL